MRNPERVIAFLQDDHTGAAETYLNHYWPEPNVYGSIVLGGVIGQATPKYRVVYKQHTGWYVEEV